MIKQTEHSKLMNKLLKYLNQEKLAKKLGCGQPRISKFKNNKVNTCPNTFYARMERLEVKLKNAKKGG